jgi:hypothetical protein
MTEPLTLDEEAAVVRHLALARLALNDLTFALARCGRASERVSIPLNGERVAVVLSASQHARIRESGLL